MKKKSIILYLLIAVMVISLPGCRTKAPTPSTQKVSMVLYGAGTLANPFKEVDTAFQTKNTDVTVQPQFGGSVKMVKQVTELNQPADVVAVADYKVIPKYMFPQNGKKFTDWYIGFATNALTFVYTDKSKGHDRINSTNWYNALSEAGVQVGRSNPDTDPSGYQTLQVLNLANKFYNNPNIATKILANSPQKNIRDTETELISALEAGQIDYLAIYKSDAIQHNLKYIDLPPQINLSDIKYAGTYKQASVTTANGVITGSPIIYAITVPDNAKNAAWGKKYAAFLLSSEGQQIMKKNGFGVITTPYANDPAKVPSELRGLVTAWPTI